MLQRIQTLYLLIVAGLFIAVIFLPLASISSGSDAYMFDVTGLNTLTQPSELIYPTWALLAIAAIVVILAFCVIFMYRKRVLQIRLCVFNMLIMIGFCILFGFYVWQIGKLPQFPDMKPTISIWSSFPVIALIINYLAIRNIGADEVLVRSLNRLR
ncbi:MAG: DUF4293 domain-containing protein [Tannerella sp.]|jgi:hypothetical protein|nr:DUF4293 domain-containing protein [Tannerella sp.]